MPPEFRPLRSTETAPLFLGLALGFSGCVAPFVYHVSPRDPDTPRLPLKVAVLKFEDKTEDFVQTGGHEGPSRPWVFNLAKGGGTQSGFPNLPAPAWSQMFAEDLQHSGIFGSVRHFSSGSALTQEDVVIQGVVLRASLIIHTLPSDFSLQLTGWKRGDREPFWEGAFSYKEIFELGECRDQKCGLLKTNEFLQEALRSIFTDARRNLARKLQVQVQEPARAP